MNLPLNSLSRKAKYLRLKPSYREGLRIQYLLKDANESFVGISFRLKLTPPSVRNVVFGSRRSARVEAEIARILGKADWNEVVLEARSAVTGKPVQAIIEEIQARLEARKKASAERFAAAMSEAIAAAKSGARRAG